MERQETIRSMEARDRDAVLDMMRAFYASPAVFTNGSEEIFENDFAACVGDSPFLNGFVCEAEGEILGYAMTAHSFSTEFGRSCVWIEDIYVAPAARGQGIGKKLLAYIERRNPGALFRLEAEAENEGAVRLYRSLGFTDLPYMEMMKRGEEN